jgi:FlaA1/EpsC-like NDP-sugar epimerase
MVRRKKLFGAGKASNADPSIVFGAGDGGVQLVRQLRRSENAQFRPVGILDDDPSKKRMVVDGVRVYGGRDHLESLVEKTSASTLIVAAPSLPPEELIDIRDRAEAAGLHVLVLPPLESMMSGRTASSELREINVNDLLGRKPARLNQTQIAGYLRGKRVMVTGAGGSIGSELCRQITRFRPAELMMLDRDESGLHGVQLSINDQAMLDGDDTILVSIRDRGSIKEILCQRKPQIVFHAAALKHMPLLEQYPLEAIKTNVLGTENLLEAAVECGVETFVNISTDKAANPCSALGTSKRIAERLTAAKATQAPGAKFVSVRFGNVLGSRGSVLTVFERQIYEGGPVTITDPDVSRFFMTIPEACQLVLQAAVVGSSGETLVLDMGEPVKIADVARTLIEQSKKDINIVYTGLRANEKMSEELFDDAETPIMNDKHEAISTVVVPPLTIRRRDVECLSSCDESRAWLDAHAY